MANRDVEIVVGAKDQASRILQRVGKSTTDLGKTSKKSSQVVQKSGQRMEAAFNGVKAAMGPLLAVLAAVKAVTAGFRFIGDSAAAFDTQQEAVRGLTTALELNGETSKDVIEQHKAFAAQLQGVVNVGDEVTLSLMKQASMLGVNNDDLQEVTRAAIGLSEATGQGLESSLRLVQRAIEGDTGALARYIPAIRTAATEEEKLALVLEASEKGLAQKADRATTAAGTAERLSNSWGDFQEVVGELLAPIRLLINSGLAVLVETLQVAVIPAIQSVTPTGEQMVGMMERLRNSVLRAVTFIEVAVTNLPTVWQLAADSTLLQVTRIIESVKHGFTVVIPSFAEWFADNFVNLITDAFNSTITVVSNAATNIEDIIKILWDNVKSGFAGGFESVMADIADVASRDLLEGFEAKTEALPEIAARQITEGERALQQSIASAANSLATEYRDKVSERLKGAGDAAGEALLDSVKLSAKQAEEALDEKKNELQFANNMIGKPSQKSLATKNVAAVESRLLTRGSTQNRPEQMVKLLERLVNEVKKVSENTKPDDSLSEDTFKVEVVT